MTQSTHQEVSPKSNRNKEATADRVGVILSVLCAIHCAATPFLLILAPTFGKIWSHPASHWGMALFVVPIAFFMLKSGYKKHGKKWIIATGTLGIIFVLIGSALPYMESSSPKSATAIVETETDDELVFDISGNGDSYDVLFTDAEMNPTASGCGTSGCTDNCCPSLVTDADGNVRLNIPPASIVTTLGGLCLIVTHVGNICSCPGCRRKKKGKSQ